MIIRSQAPFRLGLAGGGTDVSPYSDLHGGVTLNATVNLFARTSIRPTTDGKVVITNADTQKTYVFDAQKRLPLNGEVDIQIGCYNRIVSSFVGLPLSFELITSMDALQGSGLGTSSTLAVSILGAFAEWLQLPLGRYDIAHLAYEIERLDLQMAGGKQDQYAATFGGVNFMEFLADDKVIVNPLDVKSTFLNELNFNLILYYTKTSRLSATIIERQIDNVNRNEQPSIAAMQRLKEQAFAMKASFLKSDATAVGELLHRSWENKKKMAQGITNERIDAIYAAALDAGATGGKISGAGGGGFMLLFAPGMQRYEVQKSLSAFEGTVVPYQFTEKGVDAWTLK